VAAARPVTRTEPAAGTVLIDGDGFAVAPLVAAGLLTGNPPLRYLGSLTAAELGRLLAGDVAGSGRIVLTDTNRRRGTVSGRLGGSQGPLLAAGADPGATRALFGPDEQTVLRVEGGAQVSATEVGSAFGTVASGAAENALDGNPATAWRFGDFGRAVGQALTIRTDSERQVPEVRVRVSRTAGVRITRLRIAAGAASREVDVGDGGVATATFDPPVRTDTIRVTVAGVRGTGFNLVGIDEVDVPGVQLTRVARLPETLSRLVNGLDGAGHAALRRTALDVVLTRVQGTGLPGDEEEAVLARDVSLPLDRNYRAYGLVRAGALSERDLDVLAGAAPGVTAVSSSRAFGLPTLRASQALDGDRRTAWTPAGPVVGQSLRIAGPPRPVDHVDLTQLGPTGAAPEDWITRLRVSVDGKPGVEVDLRPGTTRVPIAPTTARTLTLTILQTHRGSPTGTPRLSEVDFGGARIAFDRQRAAAACVPVATVDDKPLLMRPLAPVTGLGPAVWAGCGRLPLTAGSHPVRPVAGWTPDELVFRDSIGDTGSAPARAPRTEVDAGRGPRAEVRVTNATEPYYLVTGQAYDSRWRATLDGRDLGPPIVVDGYAAGWRIDQPGTHTLRFEYAPQRVTDAALLASGVGVLGCLALLVWRVPPARPAAASRRAPPRRPARRTGHRVARAVVGWLAAVALGWLVGGVLLAGVAVVLAGWHLAHRPVPGTVLLAGVAALVAVPVSWLVFEPDSGGPLTARIVQDNPWPHRLAAIGLLLLVVGVVRATAAEEEAAAT